MLLISNIADLLNEVSYYNICNIFSIYIYIEDGSVSVYIGRIDEKSPFVYPSVCGGSRKP